MLSHRFSGAEWIASVLAAAAMMVAVASPGQAQDFGWASQLGGSSFDQGYSIAVDSPGNVYTTGAFNGTVDFDPGAGTANLSSAGSADIFVSKLDSTGAFVWARQLGGTSGDSAKSIAVDSSGNVYTTGRFYGTADFDPGAGTANLTSAGDRDIFVSKLDSTGAFVWARRLGGTGEDEGYSIAVDSSGNVCTTGYFAGTTDFDPGAGTANLNSAGGADIFVSKLDSTGAFVWARQLGGTSNNQGNSIAVDTSGNVYTTGYFQLTADFDPGAGTFNLSSASSVDIFVSKLDSTGAFVWAGQLGGTSGDEGYSIAVDTSGNVYTTGSFQGTADFDPGTGAANLSSAGGDNIFVSKLDSTGAFVWARQLGGTGSERGFSIAVDSSGNVYTTGYFYGTVDFDPGAGTFNLSSGSSDDFFVSKLDSTGAFVWAIQFHGTSFGQSQSIAVDSSGNVYTTGYFYGTADFDPGAGTANLTSAGYNDIFVSKLSQDIVPPSVSTITRDGASPTNAASVDFTVLFDEDVTGVGSGDFSIDASGVTGASVTGVAGSGGTYTVTVDTGTGDGSLSIDLSDDDTIEDLASNPLGGAGAGNGDFTSGEVYTIETLPMPVAGGIAVVLLTISLAAIGVRRSRRKG
ncbi:MAG: SBBP repeat-containing protein [Candidatus Hydrogenedentes bacterium]|nr:SBBP repeat-containing protein [Candidatus Hydrogenedentota bacterium]